MLAAPVGARGSGPSQRACVDNSPGHVLNFRAARNCTKTPPHGDDSHSFLTGTSWSSKSLFLASLRTAPLSSLPRWRQWERGSGFHFGTPVPIANHREICQVAQAQWELRVQRQGMASINPGGLSACSRTPQRAMKPLKQLLIAASTPGSRSLY